MGNRINDLRLIVPSALLQGLIVTVLSFMALAISFIIYLLIFTLFEAIGNQDGSYGFVSKVRIGYGIFWLVLYLLVYRTKLADLLKAGLLASTLATLMIGIGVQLSEIPILAAGTTFTIVVVSVLILVRTKKAWFHYYAVILALVSALIYL
jgi:hypothetical protein